MELLISRSTSLLKQHQASEAALPFHHYWQHGYNIPKSFEGVPSDELAQMLRAFVQGFEMCYDANWEDRRANQLRFLDIIVTFFFDLADHTKRDTIHGAD